jgi:hypothetical protein
MSNNSASAGAVATRRKRNELTTLPALTAEQLDGVRTLAREGAREPSLRRVLGLTPAQWKALRADQADGELSPLSLALAEGLAEGQADIISFMKRRMTQQDSESAAVWLASNVFKLGKQDADEAAPRVSIVINAAMSPEEYRRMVEVLPS